MEFVWEHEKYWEALVRMTDVVRMCAWRALGGGVGVREWDVKTWTAPANDGETGEKEGERVS